MILYDLSAFHQLIYQHSINITLIYTIFNRYNRYTFSAKIIGSEAAMPAAVGTQLFLILFEPFFILEGMTTMAAIFAPNDHPLTQASLANDTQFVAFAVALGDGLLAPPTGDVICRVPFSNVCKCLAFSHQDGICSDFIQFEVVEKLDVRSEYLMHEFLWN